MITPDLLVYYLANIIKVAQTDGKMNALAQGSLKEVCKRLQVDKKILKEAAGMVAKGGYRLMPVGRFSDKVMNLEDMLFVAVCDRRFSGEEKPEVMGFAREVADEISSMSEERQESLSHAVVDRIVRPTQRLGDILVGQGVLSQDSLMSALQDQHQSGRRLGQILLDRQLISREDLVQALGNQYRMPSIDLSRYQLESEVVHEMSHEVAAKYIAIPISRSPETLTVAIAEPSPEKIGELAAQFDIPLAFMVADEDYIKEAITGHYLVGQEAAPKLFGDESQQVKDVIPE